MSAFNIRKDEYQVVRFTSLGGPVRIQLRATAPVAIRLVPAGEFEASAAGQMQIDHNPWRRAAYLNEMVALAPGRWVAVIEGDGANSGGVLEFKMPFDKGGPSGPSGPMGPYYSG